MYCDKYTNISAQKLSHYIYYRKCITIAKNQTLITKIKENHQIKVQVPEIYNKQVLLVIKIKNDLVSNAGVHISQTKNLVFCHCSNITQKNT